MTAGKPKRGRPRLALESRESETVRVLELALLLKRMQGAPRFVRDQAVRPHGFNGEAAALRFVRKRRRWPGAEHLVADVEALLGGKTNQTQAALRLVSEHGLSIRQAVNVSATFQGNKGHGLDERGLRRALKRAGLKRCDRFISALTVSSVEDI